MYSEEVLTFLANTKTRWHVPVRMCGYAGIFTTEGYEGIFTTGYGMRESLLLVMEGVFTTEARESLLLNYVGTYLRDEV